MERFFRLLVFLFILFVNLLTTSALAGGAKSLVKGNTAFAFDLYARLKGVEGNLFLSPYSISACLAMTYAGARGDTEAQMDRVLHFGKGQSRLHSAFGELQGQLNDTQKTMQLKVVNALWAQKGEPLLPAFLSIAKDDYQASVHQANFKSGADAAVRAMNKWVGRQTDDKIQNMLALDSVDEQTALVLVNAIYFKATWACQFATYNTSTQPFHISAAKQVDASLMYKADYVKITETDEFQAVELPYLNDGSSMVILLPRQIDGLGRLEQQLSPDFLDSVLARMKFEDRGIFLPKFKMTSSFKLNEALAKMGMTDAFVRAKADFSGLNGAKDDLFISGVFHKAWVEVNEQGTEAGAGTVAIECHGGPPAFQADHPFIFFIRENRTGSVLFVGRLVNPNPSA